MHSLQSAHTFTQYFYLQKIYNINGMTWSQTNETHAVLFCGGFLQSRHFSILTGALTNIEYKQCPPITTGFLIGELWLGNS